MALINIEYGSMASSEIMNKNFVYLDNKIGETMDSVMTSISSILSNIATINARLGDMAEDISDSVSEFNSRLEDYVSKVKLLIKKNAMIPNWKGCKVLENIETFTAPSNGYLLLNPVASSKGDLKVNEITVTMKTRSVSADNSSQVIVIPMKEGDVVSTTVTLINAYFLPVAEVNVEGF